LTTTDGKTQSYHAALTPVIVAPVQATMLLSTPAFVATRDRQAEQHCELNAGTRWLQRPGRR
jgi:hypothetical protein